jgi:7,8-dihydropterin-6-yl-methyl-4-(beta-D-ribofuranosyl)aminobenzene 5'-phosphate synthase
MVLVSGEVARTTEFEKGFAIHWAKRDGAWVPDPLIIDDQCAILNIRGKGLVIVTGCGHAGIVNIIRHARRLTGVETVYTVIGGFHLSGRLFEPIIAPTVAALQAIGARYLLPAHCTGWSATHQIARTMPDAFIPNAVGTMLNL